MSGRLISDNMHLLENVLNIFSEQVCLHRVSIDSLNEVATYSSADKVNLFQSLLNRFLCSILFSVMQLFSIRTVFSIWQRSMKTKLLAPVQLKKSGEWGGISFCLLLNNLDHELCI